MNSSWFTCCNNNAIQHEKWQEGNLKAQIAAQREIDFITGKSSTSTLNTNNLTLQSNSQTHSTQNLANRASSNQKPKTTKNVVDAGQESIIYGRFDDLIDSNSQVKFSLAPKSTKQNIKRASSNQKIPTVRPQFPLQYQNIRPQFQPQSPKHPLTNTMFIRR